MKVLVTGATGFVGRHLVSRLLMAHSPADVYCLVKPPRSTAEREQLERLRNTCVHLIEGDLNDPRVSMEPPPPIDVVYHLAANTDTAATAAALRVNDLGCEHLLTWLGASLADARIIYSSSVAVLDRDGPAMAPLNETSPCVPRTEYGLTKLRGEEIIRQHAKRLRYTFTILRLATVFGPGAKKGGLFDRLIRDTAKRRVAARLNWPGRTSIVHVADVTAIMMSLADRAEAVNETYCIANPDAPTVGALAEQIAHVIDPHARPVRLPRWAWSAGRALAWTRSAQLLGAVIAQTAFWRLTLLVDDGFWFDTQKLQTVWKQPPVDLVEAIREMLNYL